jgi:hypothetical protein
LKEGTLQRIAAKSGDWGSLAKMTVGTFSMVTAGLPWRDDVKDFSCLPPGPGGAPMTYLLKNQFSPAHHRDLYHFVNLLMADGSWGPLPGDRTVPEVHNGNLAGDIFQDYAAQVEGCELAGTEFALFKSGATFWTFTKNSPKKMVQSVLKKDQWGVANSATALNAFSDHMNGEDLRLEVSWI